MNYVIFDLEWNGCYSCRTKTNINEIIEFGAVKLNEDLEIIDKYQMLVRPEISKRLNSSVKSLTSLSIEQLEHGAPFNYVYNKFKKFCGNSILMTWSTSDIVSLVSNVEYHLRQKRIGFMTKYADLQMYCHDMLGITSSNALGLQPAAEILGIDSDEIQHHRALGDSILSVMCFRKLYHRNIFETYIENAAAPDFYEKLEFHPVNIYDPDSKYIDKSVMFFNCNVCGARAEIVGEWEVKNKQLMTVCHCSRCGNDFRPKILFRQKYDGVSYTKKIVNAV